MSQVDVESLTQEISADAACGPDLSYDNEYLEMERLSAGTPERQVGTSVLEAEEPDWNAVSDLCQRLLKRSKDLRVAMLLALAELKLRGIEGLRDGLRVLHALVTRFWDQIHPQLDPTDGNDPLQRLNILQALSPTGAYGGDAMQFQRNLREAPLCRSKILGTFSLRDILVANGQLPANNSVPKPELTVIEAAFAEMDKDQLQTEYAAAQQSIELVESLAAELARQVGEGRAPQFAEFRSILAGIHEQLQAQLVRRGLIAPAMPGSASAGAAGGNGAAAVSGDIRSTRDVIDALERICDYYARYEPSSPIPLLLRRAQRLVSKNFIDIIKDLTPSSLQQIEVISGTENKEG